MPTTTNYGWTTPADTDLVKDGAAAIRTLGSSIDTTVFNNANAAIAKTIVDAKGDIIAATAADTVSRLAVGANDTVLMADSSTATGLKWGTVSSGGMTLLSTTTLSGATTTISGISGSYNSLIAFIYGVTNDTADGYFRIAPNNTTNIGSQFGRSNSVSVTSGNTTYLYPTQGSNVFFMDRASSNNAFSIKIDNYSSSSNYKPYFSFGSYVYSGSDLAGVSGGVIATNTAITSLVFSNSGGNFSAGTVLLYGVK